MLLVSDVEWFSHTGHFMSLLRIHLPTAALSRSQQPIQMVVNGLFTSMSNACASQLLWSESSVHWFADEAQSMSEHYSYKRP